jgi:uncharacterized protein involved in exopolysaccharide biosynthesis
MTFLQFLRLLRARWLMLAIGAVIGASLATLWVLFSTRTFQATSQVLVDVRPPETVGRQSSSPQEQLAPDYLSTQMDILRSARVRTRVVEKLGLAADPKARKAFDEAKAGGSFEQFLGSRLAAGLQLVPSNSSRVISINYTSRSPQDAANIANAFAEAYRDVSVELLVEPARETADWYRIRAAEVQRDLNAAQDRLSQRQRELGVTADADQTDADVTRLTGLSAQLAQIQAERAASSARASNGALPDAMASPVIQGIQSELAKLEAQRHQLAQIAGPNNLDLIQINSQIKALRQQLDAQRALISRSAAAAAAQSSASVGALSAEVQEQRTRVIESRNNRSELALLQQDVANLRETYDQIVSRRAQLGILSEGSQTNVAVLAPATPPARPYWPRPFLMLAVGMVLGFLMGGAAAIIAELSDQRIRSGEDHEAWLGIPNLGTISSGRSSAPARMSATLRRYLPAPRVGSHG